MRVTISCGAVLVDSDGVLVDSAQSIRDAFRRWANELSLDGDELFENLHGRRSLEIAEAVVPKRSAADAASRLDLYELESSTTVRALPGAFAFLEALAGNWTVVSSGPKPLILARLAAAGLPAPEHIISSETVRSGKPDRECYVRGATVNGLQPDDCVAFEDSEPGLTAALSAGCRTVRVGQVKHPDEHLLVASVPDLRAVRPRFEQKRIVLDIRGTDDGSTRC